MVPHARTATNAALVTIASAMRIQYAHEPAAIRSIDRAVEMVHDGTPHEFDGVELRVLSSSRGKAGLWQVTDGQTCSCESAHRPWCRHRTFFRLKLAEWAMVQPDFLRLKIVEQCVPPLGWDDDAQNAADDEWATDYAQAAADARYGPDAPRFELGEVVMTQGIASIIDLHRPYIMGCVSRHHAHDWGDMGYHDRIANDRAVLDGSRIVSAYHLPGGTKFYIITDAADDDGVRRGTTVLLASEY
jgi:hypothetical protein